MDRNGAVAIVANPAAGKDVRRLVAHATVTGDAAKMSIVRRAVVAADDAGAERILLAPDRAGLAQRSVEGLDLGAKVEVIDITTFGDASDSTRSAARAAEQGAGAIMVLGGDGTCRDVALGWPDAPLLPVSTGTNNVFPRWVEATVAGTAATLIASGRVAVHDGARRAKVVRILGADGSSDLALVDAVLVEGRFTASRAVWDPMKLRVAVLAVSEPATVGLSAIGGLVHPVGRDEPGGVHLVFGPGRTSVHAPIAPGLFADVPVASSGVLAEGDDVGIEGPGVLALDGERDRLLGDGEVLRARVERTGPWVIDVEATLRVAVAAGVFVTEVRDG